MRSSVASCGWPAWPGKHRLFGQASNNHQRASHPLCRHLFRVKGVLLSSAAAVAGRVPEELYWGEDLQHLPPPPPANFNDGKGP